MIKVIIAIIAVLVIAGVAWAALRTSFKGNSNSTPVLGVNQQNLISPEPDLTRVKLQTLLNQHGVLASNYLGNLYDGKDTTDNREDLDKNSQDVADLISGLGAPREQFLTMWEDHIKGYEDYTQALKANNKNKTAEAKVKLDEGAAKMGEMINKLLPSISTDQGTDLVKEHIDLTLSIIEAHAKGDVTTKATQMTKAAAQATKFANELTDAYDNSKSQ